MSRRFATLVTAAAVVLLPAAPALAASPHASCLGQIVSVESKTQHPFGQNVATQLVALGQVSGTATALAGTHTSCPPAG